jgi:hypothetical protein
LRADLVREHAAGHEKPRKDVHFHAEAQLNGWEYTAARRAVLTPILGPARGHIEDNCETALKLHALWRVRLRELRDAGWKLASTPPKYGYLRNCPPFGVSLNVTPNRCSLVHICPNCFARACVVAPLARFGRILTELDTTQLELVAFRQRYSGAIEKGLRSVFEAALAERRCEVDKPALKSLGGLTFTSLRRLVPEFVVDRRGL